MPRRVLAEVGPRTRLIVLNTPANPTGRVWPAAELEALARGLAEREGDPVWVLSDEVYRELYYGEEPPASIARYHPHALIAGSVSKSSALTGLRLGWLAGPPPAIAAATKVHQFVNTAASTVSQLVALELFRDPTAPGAHREWYAAQRRTLLSAAEREGIRLIPPEGAFYAMLALPGEMAADSVAAAERLLEAERVVTVPGRAFGASAERWLRISWVADGAALEEGMARIAEFFRRHRE
jgi:aspartate/methionine/tyrosine aminotransferase